MCKPTYHTCMYTYVYAHTHHTYTHAYTHLIYTSLQLPSMVLGPQFCSHKNPGAQQSGLSAVPDPREKKLPMAPASSSGLGPNRKPTGQTLLSAAGRAQSGSAHQETQCA